MLSGLGDLGLQALGSWWARDSKGIVPVTVNTAQSNLGSNIPRNSGVASDVEEPLVWTGLALHNPGIPTKTKLPWRILPIKERELGQELQNYLLRMTIRKLVPGSIAKTRRGFAFAFASSPRG